MSRSFDGTMWTWTLELPDQLRQAAARCRDQAWPALPGVSPARPPGGPRAILAAGMGGSGAGARLAIAALQDQWEIPVIAWSDPELPAWFGPQDLGIAVSYSGRTWETIFLADAMKARGATVRYVSGPGPLAERAHSPAECFLLPEGYAPRAALGWIFVPVALALAAAQTRPAAGAAGSTGSVTAPAGLHQALLTAADVVGLEVAALRGGRSAGERDPVRLASVLDGPAPHVYSVDEPSAVIARRWANQLHENAKQPAYAGFFTELAHNEIMAWATAAETGFPRYVILDTLDAPGPDARPEASRAHRDRTLESSLQELSRAGGSAFRIRAAGSTRLERALAQVWLGDAVSLLVAERRGIDPLPIEVMDRLKASALPPPAPPR